jgi:hypothetical protein
MSKTVEVRVRPVTRYVVTRYESITTPTGGGGSSCDTIGEFDNERNAELVANALRHREAVESAVEQQEKRQWDEIEEMAQRHHARHPNGIW